MAKSNVITAEQFVELKKEVNDISISSVKTLLSKKYIMEIKEEDYRIHNNIEIKEYRPQNSRKIKRKWRHFQK